MSGSLGSFILDDTCTFYANSHTPATGAAVDADAVPGYRVYEDETGTPILTGTMALLDDANTTGFYSEQITLSAANGFEAGKSYCIRITLVVGGVTGTQLQTLQMGARVDVRMLGGGVQSATDLKDFADDGYDPGTNKVQGVVLTDTVTTYTGNAPQTGDSFARLGATGSGLTSLATQASVTTIDDFLDTEVTTILADLDDLQTRLPAALVSGRIDASVGAMAADVLTAAAIAADAIGAAELAADAIAEIQSGLSTLTAAGVRTAVGLASANLDTQLGDLPTNAELATALGTADDATLAAIAALNNLSAVGVENAVWDAVMADHLDVGSTGASLNGAGSAGDPWTTALPGAYGAGTAGRVVGDNLNATVSSRATPAQVNTEADTALADVGVTVTITGRIDAAVSTLATAATLATVAGYLDTEIAAIKAKTDTLPSGIQKNTTLSNFSFLMIDSTNHVSPKTGLTVTATRSLDGAAFGACANAVSELASGMYTITLAAADLNGDVVVLKFSAVGGDDRFVTIVTEP